MPNRQRNPRGASPAPPDERSSRDARGNARPPRRSEPPPPPLDPPPSARPCNAHSPMPHPETLGVPTPNTGPPPPSPRAASPPRPAARTPRRARESADTASTANASASSTDLPPEAPPPRAHAPRPRRKRTAHRLPMPHRRRPVPAAYRQLRSTNVAPATLGETHDRLAGQSLRLLHSTRLHQRDRATLIARCLIRKRLAYRLPIPDRHRPVLTPHRHLGPLHVPPDVLGKA